MARRAAVTVERIECPWGYDVNLWPMRLMPGVASLLAAGRQTSAAVTGRPT